MLRSIPTGSSRLGFPKRAGVSELVSGISQQHQPWRRNEKMGIHSCNSCTDLGSCAGTEFDVPQSSGQWISRQRFAKQQLARYFARSRLKGKDVLSPRHVLGLGGT